MNGRDARRGLRALGLAAVLAALTLVAAGDASARTCGADSDCAVGKCSSGRCGACGADSDCHGGRCSGGRCSNALSSTGPLTGAALRAALAEVVRGTQSCAAR